MFPYFNISFGFSVFGIFSFNPQLFFRITLTILKESCYGDLCGFEVLKHARHVHL